MVYDDIINDSPLWAFLQHNIARGSLKVLCRSVVDCWFVCLSVQHPPPYSGNSILIVLQGNAPSSLCICVVWGRALPNSGPQRWMHDPGLASQNTSSFLATVMCSGTSTYPMDLTGQESLTFVPNIPKSQCSVSLSQKTQCICS